MKGLRKSLAVIVAAVMLLTLVPTGVLAQVTEDTLTGTFSVNAPPSITSVTLTETAMTPQMAYNVTVAVTDADKLSDLTEVKLVVYYDSDGTYSETEAKAISAGATKTAAIFTWTITEGAPTAQPTMDPAHSEVTPIISWVLGTCTYPTMTETSGNFVFKFKPGKVATEAPNATDPSSKWHVAAKVTDTANPSVWAADAQGATMAWYGEVTVGPTEVDFGSLTQGTAFNACAPQTLSTSGGITYVSNGAWDAKVKSSSPWDSTATLYTTDTDPGSMPDNNFSLKAKKDTTLTGAVMVTTGGVAIDETGTITDEEPSGVTTNTLWIQLASTFAGGTYTGTITYIIADGV